MADKPVLLEAGGYRFDPAQGLPDLPPGLIYGTDPPGAAFYIVQFRRSPTREDRARLQKQFRLALSDYVWQWGYIEELDAPQRRGVEGDTLVRAVVRYHPAFKISPYIGGHEFRTKQRLKVKGLLVWIVLFPGGNPRSISQSLVAGGGEELGIIDDREIGGTLRIRAVLARSESLAEIARIEDVRWIEEIGEIVNDNVNAATTIQSGTATKGSVWIKGLHGEGQIIGMIDDGPPDIEHCYFKDPTGNIPSPSHRKIIAIRNVAGTGPQSHSTFVAGCIAGDDFNHPGAAARRGGAWAARLVCGNHHDLEVFGGTASLYAELIAAANLDAFMHTNSWHESLTNASNQAIYSQTAVDADAFAWTNEDHLVLGSAGNSGEEQGAPGTAKNALCVAATRSDPNETTLGDGHPGPTADGRRKPDLAGIGCGINSADADTVCGIASGPCATSWATAHLAAAAALVRQYFTEGWYPSGTQQSADERIPSGALMKATLLNATRPMTLAATNGYPNHVEGWGVIRLDDALFFAGDKRKLRVWDIRHAEGVSTGETADHHVDVATSVQSLKVTLVWTDPPSGISPSVPLVNNLDLQVLSPGGTETFLGNVFVGSASATGGIADATDNAETVVIGAPAPGRWTIKVIATSVNVASPGQGYALVVTGDLADSR